FVLSGSSTVDVTFAAFVNCALVAFAIGVSRREDLEGTRITSFAFFIFSALAFLTKGPAGLMLIALPICAFCLIEKNLACLRTLNWWIGTILFCAISVPWFYLVEKAVPGSNWYFFVHENFLRFLVKDYGGRHGAAHVHSYGYIWLMLLISIFPWSALLVRDLFFSAKSFSSFKYNSETRWPIYALFCGLAPMVFFTFARSILPAYVLPGIPGLSIFLGYVIYEISLPQSKISISRFSRGYYPNTAVLASSMVVVMLAGLLVAMPFIEPNKSASAILEVIADESRGTDTVVGVTTANNYSPFWTSGAYEQELSRPLKIAFADQSDLRNAKFKNLIVRDGEAYNFLNEHRESYREVASRGKWRWYTRNTQATN
ncbi:MAG: hypothetical protein KDD53_10455, partial [Bdellovibrionales bacterium]|nr:hypothetical protein [Bdellovibrionales bacterium]